MQYSLKATKIELTQAIKDAVAKKLSTLDAKVKRFGTSVTAAVEVGMTSKHHKKGLVFRAEIQISLPGKKVYAEAVDEDLYKALSAAKKEVEVQVKKYKDMKEAKTKKVAKTSRA